jgi:tellurite resistance protein TerC
MWSSHEAAHPNKNPVIKYVSRLIPVTKEFDGEHFFVKRKHITAATPLFVALMVVETTDVMFAFDSIPAIFAITTDPFLVFTSNIFAILGLRSLYFVLASVLDRFKYLQHALVFILAYVGVKMLLVHHVHIPEWLSLVVIFVSLGAGVLFSLYKAPKAGEAPAEEPAQDIAESASRQLDARSEQQEQ